MEKTPRMDRENVFKELKENPELVRSHLNTLYSGLDLCQEILDDLSMGRAGQINNDYKEYIVSVNNIVRQILERQL
jgi:hypothetical protein